MPRWIEAAIKAMKSERDKRKRELEDLNGDIAEAELRAFGKPKVGRRPKRRDKIVRLLRSVGEATPSQIASAREEPHTRASVDQTLRINPTLFERCGKDGRETKWRLKKQDDHGKTS